MPLQGDFSALAAFHNRLRKLSGATREIALTVSPQIEGLVNGSFAGQSTPYGESWTPTKSGAPAFGGGDSGGRVLVRLVGKATVKTSVLYPLHFHNQGTHAGGRKAQAKLRKKLRGEGYSRAGIKGVLQQLNAGRKAGAWHDPPRPMIPDDAAGIPPEWSNTIRQAATAVLSKAGAVAK